ncbi:hypothetical protein GGTG_08812 [Gaeumannomyces tritici R3-111a-1]|uniref:Uncharacterized protein n=1 Tax=Gaeumannomyces tritici (strain R3-111a-1) TaxID=644352 RepID=J3P5M2_GAET3|nr:hypothetical protein GGTG_08812 [Gaeumannomyces tritici R3-111a-1]EJT74974.1 hypothetical protein GGTG_08812 [Gaeumannomyces tritici R3-111a-1]
MGLWGHGARGPGHTVFSRSRPPLVGALDAANSGRVAGWLVDGLQAVSGVPGVPDGPRRKCFTGKSHTTPTSPPML